MAQSTRHPSTRSRVVIAITLALAVTGTLVSAQTIRSTLTGAVTDPNGAVVTGVLVTATNVATNIATTTKTNNDGLYAFTALTPGEYVLAVEQKGFKRFVQSGIVLQIAQATRLDVPLEVGGEIADGGNCYRIVRVEQPSSLRGFGHAWAELVDR